MNWWPDTDGTLRKYFPKSYTPQRMQETIIKLPEAWQKKHQRDQERWKEPPMMDISARELKGHNILAVERFWDNTRWMIEFSVLRPSTATAAPERKCGCF